MQKNVNKLLSSKFVELFKQALIETYHYKIYMDYIIVPSLMGSRTLSYVPLLNYTDKEYLNIKDLIELAKDNNFQIKSLNFNTNSFSPNDPVTMRLTISPDKDLIQHYKSRTRSYVRKSLKKSFFLREGCKYLDDFYLILRQTYKKHGTPLPPKNLFKNLFKSFQTNFHLFVLYKNHQIAATMLILQDENLSWYGWGGVDKNLSKELAGYAVYHLVIEKMVKKYSCNIFDFGRSPYKGGTYQFKSNFGAKPIKIEITKNNKEDIYQKYALYSNIYKKLPLCLTDKIGLKLTKYLVDL